MEDKETTLVEYPLGSGINRILPKQGEQGGIRELDNMTLTSKGTCRLRGGIVELPSAVESADIAALGFGGIRQGDGHTIFTDAHQSGLEIETVRAVSSAARISHSSMVYVADSDRYVMALSQVTSELDGEGNGNTRLILMDASFRPLDEVAVDFRNYTTYVRTGASTGWLIGLNGAEVMRSAWTISGAGNDQISATGPSNFIGHATSLSHLGQLFAAYPIGANIEVYLVTSPGHLYHFVVDAAASVVSQTQLSTGYGGSPSTVVGTHASSPIHWYAWYNHTLGSFSTQQILGLTTHNVITGLTEFDRRCIIVAVDGGDAAILITEDESPSKGISWRKVDNLGAVTAQGGTIENAMIASEGIALPDGETPLFVVAAFETAEQEQRSAAFVTIDPVTLRLRVVAMASSDDFGVYSSENRVGTYNTQGLYGRPALASWALDADGDPILMAPYIQRSSPDQAVLAYIDLSSNDVYDRWSRGVRLVRVKQGVFAKHGQTKFGDVTFYGGAMPSYFDGLRVHPIAFPVISNSPLIEDSGFTSITEGTYSYAVRTSHVGHSGLLIDSPFVGAPGEVDVFSDGPNVTVFPSVVWRDLNVEFRTDVFRNPYPREDGDLTQRLVMSVGHTTMGATATLIDARDPDQFLANELRPDAVSGALQAGCLPALLHLTGHRSRLVGVDMFDRQLVRFTTEFAWPTAPYWNGVLAFRVANSGGQVTAVASLGDRLFVFQEAAVSYVTGEGPDAAGIGTFSLPELLVVGLGVPDGQQAGVVETPEGVMFNSATGIMMIGAGGDLQPIGAQLQEYPSQGLGTVLCAAYVPHLRQTWFCFAGGVIYVFHNSHSVWTRYTTRHTIVDMAVADGNLYLFNDNNQAMTYDESAPGIDDDGTNTDTVVGSVVIQPLRAERGTQLRTYQALIAGEDNARTGTHTIQLLLTRHDAHSAPGTAPEVATFEAADTDLNDIFDFPVRYGERGNRFEAELRVSKTAGADTPEFTSLALEVQTGGGRGKIPATNKATRS